MTTTYTPDARVQHLIDAVNDCIRGVGAVEHAEGSCRQWRLTTTAGYLHISPVDVGTSLISFCTIFDEPARACRLLGPLDKYDQPNPNSGKWNAHWDLTHLNTPQFVVSNVERRLLKLFTLSPDLLDLDRLSTATLYAFIGETRGAQPRTAAGKLFPDRTHGATIATHWLHLYAWNRVTCRACTERDDPVTAQHYDDICTRIHANLPEWAQWRRPAEQEGDPDGTLPQVA